MRPVRVTTSLALLAALALASPAAHAGGPSDNGAGSGQGSAHGHRGYLMGAAVESINPTPDQIAAGDFFLGGFGLGSNRVGNRVAVPGLDGRYAKGILKDALFPDGSADGVHVRAVVVGAGKQAIALAQIETQGMFVAYKQGPFGLIDIRKDAAAAIAALPHPPGSPAITAGSVLVDSNHTHGGPDTAGVWGGVPTAYLKYVHDQSVKAIVEAYQALQPVHLFYGTAHAGVGGEPQYDNADPLLNNQFSNDPLNQEVDDELRVLQARDDVGNVVATYLNFSAHPTVLGGSNRLVTGDYTGPLAAMLSTLGGIGMEQVATLGRTQPNRGDCPDPTVKDSALIDVCKLNAYATRVFERTKVAIGNATELTGKPVVSLHSYFMQDFATNAPILALSYGGLAAGAPIYRAINPPWTSANTLGTPSFSGRIGDVLISGGPGEIYPQIVQKVREAVPARGHINIGTAGDVLGYIVAPLEAYPEPIRRSLFDGAPFSPTNTCSGVPSPAGCPSPISNDNYFFNVSHTFGERLTCSLLRGAGETMTGDPSAYWSTYERCGLFANDYALKADLDTTFPAQPDLSAVLDH